MQPLLLCGLPVCRFPSAPDPVQAVRNLPDPPSAPDDSAEVVRVPRARHWQVRPTRHPIPRGRGHATLRLGPDCRRQGRMEHDFGAAPDPGSSGRWAF